MVYFPRETISFSHSTVLSSAGFSSLFCHFYTSFCFPVAASLSTVFMCLCVSTDWESALLEKTDKVPLVKQNGFSALECLILYFLVGGSFFLDCLLCPWCWAGGTCSSMARLLGRCTEPCEYCDWLSSTNKVAYGTTSAQQSFSWTYGWQLADSMFFSINPRSGCFGPHASGTVCGGGQLRKTRACRNQSSSRRGGRRHWKEWEWWVIKTDAKQYWARKNSTHAMCM